MKTHFCIDHFYSQLPEGRRAMKGHSNLFVSYSDENHELKTGDIVKMKLNSEDAKCLTEEVFLLEKQLDDQLLLRSVLEKAFTSKPLSIDDENNENPIAKPVMDLVKEISDLESQIVHLEKHLLSLYRETFDEKIPIIHPKSRHNRASSEGCWQYHIPSHHDYEEHENGSIFVLQAENSVVNKNIVINSGINRSNSSISRVDPYHSLPLSLSMLENSNDGYDAATSSLCRRSGHFNHLSETPNWISEEMIKHISSIYCELASDSSRLSFSPETDSSPREYNYIHTECREDPSFPNEMPLNRSSSSQNTVAVMQFNFRDSQRLKTVKHKLWSFKLLVSRLERVDPKIMTDEEKLAFWINVHNALIMHAYIVYGIPHYNLKRRTSFFLKAAYIVGGHAISIEMIQKLILGCRLVTSQGNGWLQSLFNFKTKFKAADSDHRFLRHYAVHHQENRLYFALCSGIHSDPMVRVFTPKRVFEELEAAKEDYIRTNIIIVESKLKVILPKIVYLFVRDSQMLATELMDMIKPFLWEKSIIIRKNLEEGKMMKKIEWMSQNFNFRYLIGKEFVK